MLDEIGDSIVHLLRNAIDHGIEPPEDRAAAGKPAVGRLVLSAARDRSAVVIKVSDDGQGIDRDRVLARAKRDGLVDDDEDGPHRGRAASPARAPGLLDGGEGDGPVRPRRRRRRGVHARARPRRRDGHSLGAGAGHDGGASGCR